LKRLFDRKISDTTIKGYDVEEVRKWLSDVREIDSLKYYYYPPGSKFLRESKNLKKQSSAEVLSFLKNHFPYDTPDFFVEIQRKLYRSGKCEIIFREITAKREITKIAVLDLTKPSS
jgi:hypothetical protein